MRRKEESERLVVTIGDDAAVSVASVSHSNSRDIQALVAADSRAMVALTTRAMKQLVEAQSDTQRFEVLRSAIAQAHAAGQALQHNAERARRAFEMGGVSDEQLAQDADIHAATVALMNQTGCGLTNAWKALAARKVRGRHVWFNTRKNKHGGKSPMKANGLRAAYERHEKRVQSCSQEKAKPLAELVDDSFTPLVVTPAAVNVRLVVDESTVKPRANSRRARRPK